MEGVAKVNGEIAQFVDFVERKIPDTRGAAPFVGFRSSRSRLFARLLISLEGRVAKRLFACFSGTEQRLNLMTMSRLNIGSAHGFPQADRSFIRQPAHP